MIIEAAWVFCPSPMEHLPDLCILLILKLLPDLFYDFLWIVECGEDLFQNSRHVEERRSRAAGET
jgi:hypothetical protein